MNLWAPSTTLLHPFGLVSCDLRKDNVLISVSPKYQRTGVVPVVVIGPPRAGMVVVVEVAWNMDYLYENNPIQRKPASEYFPPGTMLTCESSYCKDISNH
jgi:hypothetical protein